jgi:hypothetical protein
MDIELEGIPLNKTEQNQAGGVLDVRNISNISTSDRREMVEHDIPGMEGNVFQNLGRSPVNISFDGILQGKSAKSNLETIRSKFKQGIPLSFNSNISGAADVTKVLIDDLRITEVGGESNRYSYSIVLMEYKEPPPEPTTPPSQDEDAKEWAKKTAEEAVESINYLAGKVLDSEGNPKSGVDVLAKSKNGEYTGKTNEDGIYRIDELPPGKYRIFVDAEEYKGVEEEVTIGKGGEDESGGQIKEEEETEEEVEEKTEGETEDDGEEVTEEDQEDEKTEDEPKEEIPEEEQEIGEDEEKRNDES